MPLFARASSIGPTALKRISHPGAIGIVDSVFPSAVNILTPDKHLISVVNRRVGRGPINIVADPPNRPPMSLMGVERGDSVWKCRSDLIIPNRVIISTAEASLYCPEKFFGNALLRAPEIENNLTAMLRSARLNGRSAVADYLTRHMPSRFRSRLDGGGKSAQGSPRGRIWSGREVDPFGRMALPHMSDLLLAIRGRNYPEVRRSAANLVGLGPGLTPSADDVLAGLTVSLRLAGVNRIVDENHVTRVIGEISSCVPNRTTMLSEEFLMHAAVGEANEPVMGLLKRILTAGPEEVRKATRKLLAVGETSGTEIALGIGLGIQLALDTRIACGVAC